MHLKYNVFLTVCVYISHLITELHNVSPSIFSSTSAILLIPLSLLVVALSKRSKP